MTLHLIVVVYATMSCFYVCTSLMELHLLWCCALLPDLQFSEQNCRHALLSDFIARYEQLLYTETTVSKIWKHNLFAES
jgi:hypothetical protein